MENSLQEQTPPFSLDAEMSVLGSVLLDPSTLPRVTTLIEADDFYKRSHQIIFNAILSIYDREGRVDTILVINQLDSYDELENIGGRTYIMELYNYTPTTYHAEQYAQIVKNKSMLRRLIAVSQTISHEAFQEADDVAEIIERSERLILSIGEDNHSNRPKEIRKVIAEAYDRLIELSENQEDVVGLPTGYIELDKLTHGFQPTQFIVLAARPAVGKTAFALNIAQNVATQTKKAVVIFSLEMGAVDLVNRMICAEGNIHASHLRTGQLTDDEWNSFTVATDILKDAKIYIDDSAGGKVSEIRAKCRRLKQEDPDLSMIIIDYLQLIEGNGRENRQQEVSEISRQLKRLAMELEVPIMALSQLSRGLEQRQNKRPILSDIRESGSIEQDADIVAFLYREDYHQHEPEGGGGGGFQASSPPPMDDLPDNTVEVIVAKNRAGATGTIQLLFKKEYNKFSTLSYRPDFPG